MWRKSRKPNQGSTCVGTDINRNFNHEWGSKLKCCYNIRVIHNFIMHISLCISLLNFIVCFSLCISLFHFIVCISLCIQCIFYVYKFIAYSSVYVHCVSNHGICFHSIFHCVFHYCALCISQWVSLMFNFLGHDLTSL